MMIEGMGHDLPRVLWPRLINAFASHAAEADRPHRGRPRGASAKLSALLSRE
jgi:hypothetical protein